LGTGYIYTDPAEKASLVQDGDSYAIIVDESMKIGGQKKLLMRGEVERLHERRSK
jgi:hypothetical protein